MPDVTEERRSSVKAVLITDAKHCNARWRIGSSAGRTQCVIGDRQAIQEKPSKAIVAGVCLLLRTARATVLLVTADKARGAGSEGESCETTVGSRLLV